MYEHYSQSIFNLTHFNRDQNVDTLSLAYLTHLIKYLSSKTYTIQPYFILLSK